MTVLRTDNQYYSGTEKLSPKISICKQSHLFKHWKQAVLLIKRSSENKDFSTKL